MTPAPTKRSESRKTEKMLVALLATPKTRAGLIAAVSGSGLSKHFIYGWIGEQLRAGDLTELKASRPSTFQMANKVIVELPPPGFYPAWLEPRRLPATLSRRAYFDGRSVGNERNRPQE